MKHKLSKFALFLPLAVLSLTGCAGEKYDIVLRVYNCEDYMADSVLEDFMTYESAKISAIKTAELGYDVDYKVGIVYDAYDTNETMMSALKTGKTTYDVICASDYTLQKMVSQKMCQKINMANIPNYSAYCSPFLLDKLASIETTLDQSTVALGDYSVGYMWGTLGVLYNPLKVARDKGITMEVDGEVVYDVDSIKADMAEWHSLWNPKYQNEMSVKDSMRDTYSIGVMEHFDARIRELLAESGHFDEELNLLPGHFDDAMATYNKALTDIFNACDEETVSQIEKTLLDLKANVFGFEVDSGKDDMVKGLVGMNLAWSGDAVYSMDRGDNESGQTIYYSVPKTGGNIWFDGWVMMNGIDDAHVALAEDFLNFLCDPEVASVNMEDIGYTSFIAGDVVHGLIRDWYDPRTYAMYVYEEADWWEDNDFAYDEDGNKIYQTGFDPDNDDPETFEWNQGILDMTGSTYEAPVIDGVAHTWDEYFDIYNEKAEIINALLDEEDQLELLEGWDVRDLTYMFSGTLDYNSIAAPYGDTPETNPYLFYTDELETVTNEAGEECIAGRQFYAQYPDHTMIPKLAVMSDYGANNQYVLAMWQNVKANNLPLWGVVLFGIILAVAVVGIIAYFVGKHEVHKIKVKRRRQQNALREQLNK